MRHILINGPWSFEQIFNPLLAEGLKWSLMKIGPRVSEKLFKGVDRWRTEWWRWTKSDHIAHSEPSAKKEGPPESLQKVS